MRKKMTITTSEFKTPASVDGAVRCPEDSSVISK